MITFNLINQTLNIQKNTHSKIPPQNPTQTKTPPNTYRVRSTMALTSYTTT